MLKSFFKKFISVEESGKKSFSSTIERSVNPTDIWEIISELGDGAFGKVYKTHKRNTDLFAALKRVDFESEDELEDFMLEIDILTNFKHKNILTLHEVYIYESKLWIYLELCGGGALDSIMEALEKPLTEPQIRFVSREVLQGLEFLHEKLIIHRDMKAGNILLTLSNEVKLADFGVSAKLADEKQKRSTFIGTPYWMAPEVINCETFKDAPYNWKADIWSFGITLIELAQKRPPHNATNPTRVLLKILKSDPPTLSRPHLWSSKFKTFLGRTLQKDPNQRPECRDLLLDPFVSDVTESDRKVIQILLCEVNADIIETVEDFDPNEPIDEIDDNDLNPLILSDSTKLSIPVEMVCDDGDDDVDDHKNDVIGGEIDNSKNDHESNKNLKQINDNSGDSGVSLGQTTSENQSDSNNKMNDHVIDEIADQLITDVITSETQSPSITSCVFESMNDIHSIIIKSPNTSSNSPATNITTTVVSNSTDKTEHVTKVNGNVDNRVRETIVHPKKQLNTSETTEHKSSVVNDILKDPPSSSPSATDFHDNNNKSKVVISPLKRQNSAYRTRTRTRRFVIDGQTITTTSKRIVNTNLEDKKFREDEQIKRKAALRAFRILAKQEAHQTRELNERAQQQIDILENKMNAEFSTLTKTYDHKMEIAIRNYKLQMERLDKEFEVEMKRIRTETSKEERTFKDRLKNEIDTYDRAMRKAAKRDLNKYDHIIQSNSSLTSLKSNNSTTTTNTTTTNNNNNSSSLVSQRLTIFRENQESRMNSRIYDLHNEYNKRRNLIHSEYLNEIHTLRLNFEEDKWRTEHRFLSMKHQLDRNRQLDLFMIKREQLTGRSELELTELKQTINMERSKLQAIHSIERKNCIKSMKSVHKRSILTLQRQSRLNTIQMNEAQKRMNEELELLESKQKAQTDELEKSIHFRLQELEQSTIEKRNALIDQETKRLQELDNRHQNEMRIYSESLPRIKALMKEQFAQEYKEDSFKLHNYHNYRSYSPKSHKSRLPIPMTSLTNLRWGSLSNSNTKLNHLIEPRSHRILTLFSSDLNNTKTSSTDSM
uniref:LOK-like protein kinase n=3 Tax=Schistosoma mansoni TaxID=6183 RepID=A0A5K4FBA9_SCHMA